MLFRSTNITKLISAVRIRGEESHLARSQWLCLGVHLLTLVFVALRQPREALAEHGILRTAEVTGLSQELLLLVSGQWLILFGIRICNCDV